MASGALSQSELDYFSLNIAEASCGVSTTARNSIMYYAKRHAELHPGEGLWWDERCDELVFRLEDSGIIARKRGSAPIRPALGSPYDCYKIVRPCLSQDDLSKAGCILDGLDARVALKNDRLRNNPGLLLDNEAPLKALSAWLVRRWDNATEVATRERCYEIWDDEKAFDTGGMRRLLASIGFDTALLKIHDSKDEEFPTYIAPGDGVVVISENQDMWHSIRWLIERGGLVIDGVRIKGVVKGDGHRIERDGCQSIVRFLGARGVSVQHALYIGDIDPEGIAIQQKLEDDAGICPWRFMYRLMAARHAARLAAGHGMRPHIAQVRKGDIDRFLSDVMGPAAEDARAALYALARIPQEIVSLETLKEISDGE